jgi:hypothetical protein
MKPSSQGSAGVTAWARPERHCSRLELAVVPAAVRIARHWTADQLAGTSEGPGGADLIDSAVLAVSELVTNAITAVIHDAAAIHDAAVFHGAAPHDGPQGLALAVPGRILSFGDQPNGAGLPTSAALLPSTAEARVSLVIARFSAFVRIEVHDSSCAPVPPACHRDAAAETGRGLMVVAALARRWGWEPESSGKVVWCELAS